MVHRRRAGRLNVLMVFVVVFWLGIGAGAGAQGRSPFRGEITVTHWGVLLYGVPYAIAQEMGFFEEEGIALEGIVTSEGGGTTVRNVLQGRLPFGEVSTFAALTAHKAGAPLVIVGGGSRSVAEILWVTRQGEPIRSIQDLKGKTVAFTTPGSVTHAVLTLAIEEAEGIDLSDVHMVAMGGLGAGLTALAQGGVDAAPIMDPVWASQSDRWQPVFWAKDYVPHYMQTVFIVPPRLLQERPEVVRAFIDARRRGAQYLYDHPDRAAEIFARAYDLPVDVARRSIENVRGERWWSLGGLDREGLQAVERVMLALEMIDGPVDWQAIVDQSLLPQEERIPLP